MRGTILIGVSMMLLALAAKASPPPVEAFGDIPHVEYGRLSPDGKHLAVIRPVGGRNKVVFTDLSKPDAEPYIVGMEGGLASEIYWKSNSLAVVVFHAQISYRGIKTFFASSRALGVNLDTRTATLLMSNAPYYKLNLLAGYIADLAVDDPTHVYMMESDRWDRKFMLGFYKVDITTGLATLVTHGSQDTFTFLTDGHGHVVGQIDQDWNLNTSVILNGNEVLSYNAKGGNDFDIDGLTTTTPLQFAVRRQSATGTTGLYTWSGSSGFGSPLFENATYDLNDTITDERDGHVIGATYVDDMPRTKYFDPSMAHVQELLEKAYPGQSVTITSRDQAGTGYVFSTQGPKNPPVLSLYTPADHKTGIIEEAYPDLKSADLGDVRPYPYKARDGYDVHAYLTLPPGRDPHHLPAVIFPHGGPEARDAMEFDWWAQFMATRGYAVLQPNYRGSAGYGAAWVRQGDGEWAGKVQYDVQDGVKKLIDDGIVDPKRICIVGASYGGYMALAGATFSPDLYACAISIAGLSDLDRMLDEGTTFESEGASLWKRRIGADKDSAKVKEASPANFAANVKIPVLLIHAEKDTTVPIRQSEVEEEALKRAGKNVQFVKLDGDDHYLEFPEARIKMLREVETFLAANIGDKAPK
jgi:acetyl esterase/lipase